MAYPYSGMPKNEIEDFLSVQRFATVGTNRLNGAPQLTTVWYLYENEVIYITMFAESAKYRNLSRDPRVSVCIAGDHPDARSVVFYGTAELLLNSSADWVDEIEWRLGRQYFDSDEEAKSYLDTEGAGGESALAVITPEKVIAQNYN